MVSRKLADILDGIKVLASSGDISAEIKGMTMDSRQVEPGDLYACVPGANADGHDFAAEVIEKGASALLVERLLPFGIPQVQVDHVRDVLGKIAANLYGYPSSRLEMVGVTGTNGKTTITYLVEQIMKKQGKKAGLIGTLGSRIAGREIPGSRTTPEAVDLQKLLAMMVDEKAELVVMEVSSHALALGRVQGIEFDAAIFTNLTQDHLDYHKTMEGYLQAKARLFKELKGDKQPKVGIINGDDPAAQTLCQVSAARTVLYGIHAENLDYRADNIQLSAHGIQMTVHFQGKSQEIHYRTPGLFSVYNALAAFAWAIESGRDAQLAADALAEIHGVPGRFENVRAGQPFPVIVDYAHTPDGLENVLKTAREFTQGRLITVFGCGGDRDKGKRPQMGEISARLSDFVIVTSDNPRTEEPEQIIKDILGGVSGVEYTAMVNRREAIETACRIAQPGDTVLIAGKGHEDYQIIGHETFPFDDREVAKEALRGLGYVGK